MCTSEASAASGISVELVLDSRDWDKAPSFCLEWRERVLFVRGGGGGLLVMHLLHVSVGGLPPLKSVSSRLTDMSVEVLAETCPSLWVGRCMSAFIRAIMSSCSCLLICSDAAEEEDEEEEDEEMAGGSASEVGVASGCSCKAWALLSSASSDLGLGLYELSKVKRFVKQKK